jgi:23S rRNA (cytosine1962-C5)-methyltransferase
VGTSRVLPRSTGGILGILAAFLGMIWFRHPYHATGWRLEHLCEIITRSSPMQFETLLTQAISARFALFDPQHQLPCRLFNGFLEGEPRLVIDLYATTVVLHNYANPPEEGQQLIAKAQQVVQALLPWVQAILLKTRRSSLPAERNGRILAGERLVQRVREHGVWYAIDLTMNRDTSFYLDTRNLRHWAINNLEGRSVLNTFAYTGSLGVAAQAGGAARVVQLDLNRQFLNVAKTSYTLNGFPINKADFQTGDFWPQISQLNRKGERFDCVFLDPPFFAASDKGVVDLERNYIKLINKVRPLINDGGVLVAINNALFLSGADYMRMLESVCADGYVQLEDRILVPEDSAGYPHTRCTVPLIDPAPFNHATKIALLRIRRKAEKMTR